MRSSTPSFVGRALAAAGLAAVLAACTAPTSDAPQPGDPVLQPDLLAEIRNAQLETTIPGQYIIVFQSDADFDRDAAAQETAVIQRYPDAQAIIRAFDIEILHSFSAGLTGVGVEMPGNADQAQEALRALLALPDVDYIEANQRGAFFQTIVQPNPTWGLDRIDERVLPLDSQYAYDGDGTNVHAYIIDSGMRATHDEFGGRASLDFTVHSTGDMSDCADHGTHVGATVGGAAFGVAKDVMLHSVRVGNDFCIPDTMSVIAGVQWVTTNRSLPAVATMSLGVGPSSALDTAVNASIASGVTYVVAAGNANADACGGSPARIPNAITVGATTNSDARWGSSNFGTCVDLFAPGANITSATNVSDTSTGAKSGTSMAAPHVAGVAARYLGDFPGATPAAVWTRIAGIANGPATAGWPGVANRGPGSPNRLLVWQALDDARDDGDPHLTTVDGTRYDFQAAGEFVALFDRNGAEIQTRQIPVRTARAIGNAHTGVTSCVSVNAAVAARVGDHRVSFQPSRGDRGRRMTLRLDGTAIDPRWLPVSLGDGGRIARSPTDDGGVEITFPDGAIMTANPWFWSPHSQWMLQISVFDTPAKEGLLGLIEPGEWLPRLPDGSSVGARPASEAQRFTALNRDFADAWRVSEERSLFDYAPGESTRTFTEPDWPPASGQCDRPDRPAVDPVSEETARIACERVGDQGDRRNCIIDVQVMGDPDVAAAYAIADRLRAGGTRTHLTRRTGQQGMELIATVRRLTPDPQAGAPQGAVQFSLEGERLGQPIRLDRTGRAVWVADGDPSRWEDRAVIAQFIPRRGSNLLRSTSDPGRPPAALESADVPR